MNIVLITTLNRRDILRQSIESMIQNAADWSRHTLTIVQDGAWDSRHPAIEDYAQSWIKTRGVGASRARNIGAASVPMYLRQDHIMFVDDDIYACPNYDKIIESTLKVLPTEWCRHGVALSSHSHPFNHHTGSYIFEGIPVHAAGVLSTVHMTMPWWMWDIVGPFAEPGGAGGSEDVDWCKRANKEGYGLAVTEPECIIHTGIHSSTGKPIVGAELVQARNKELEKIHGVEGRVVYS